MTPFSRTAISFAAAGTLAGAALVAAAHAHAAATPSAISFVVPNNASIMTPCTMPDGSTVTMGAGDSFELYNSPSSASGPQVSVQGGSTFYLMPGQSHTITFSSMGMYAVNISGCGMVTVNVVYQPPAKGEAIGSLQQIDLPASGDCGDVAASIGHKPGYPFGGWSRSWARWANHGQGGPICTRQVTEHPDGKVSLTG